MHKAVMDMNGRRRLTLHGLPEDLENARTVRRRELSGDRYEHMHRRHAA